MECATNKEAQTRCVLGAAINLSQTRYVLGAASNLAIVGSRLGDRRI